MKITITKDGHSYLLPFLRVTSLFFLWGFAHAILEVLNPHLKELLGLSHANAAWVQVATYGAYFLMAIPAGKIIRRWGYRGGVLTGLVLYGIGALLFLPICFFGVGFNNPLVIFVAFIGALFVIGCGLTCLETSANPYVTVLGDKNSAEQRINFAQSLNGLGWVCGPLIGGLFFFDEKPQTSAPDIFSVALPYLIVGIVVLFSAIAFSRCDLPEVDEQNAEKKARNNDAVKSNLWKNKIFVLGVVALFLYVAAQTGVNSNFVAYMKENAGIAPNEASKWLAFGGMGLFFVMRIVGSWVMGFVKAERLLLLFAIGATIGSLVVVMFGNWLSMVAFFLIFLCESIMFPTIFALALRGAEGETKRASSYLVMTIVGGAVAPYLMGLVADNSTIALAFVVPMVCYIFIAVYASLFTKNNG